MFNNDVFLNFLFRMKDLVLFDLKHGVYNISHKGVWVPLTPPFLRRRFFVKNPLVNPLLKSVSCVPPLGWGPFNENP